MAQQKVNLTKKQLNSLLKNHGYVKKDVAQTLGVDESSIRRACDRLHIDTNMEKKALILDSTPETFKVAKPSKGTKVQASSFVVIPDLHSKWVSWPYLNVICSFIKDFKPEYVIQIGDLFDFECLMKSRKQKYPSFDAKDLRELRDEFEVTSKILSFITKSTPADAKRIFMKGNHEYRADELLKDHPELDTIIDIKKRMDWGDWQIKEYLDPEFRLGKLHFIHGEFFGQYHVRKHLQHYQKNLIYGHTHGIQQDTMASPMRKIPIWGAAIGCGCDVNPDYQRNKSNRWQHGFAYGWFERESGDFDCQIKRVINYKFWAEGRRYHA